MKIPPKNSARGRKKRTAVDKFQTQAWYNSIIEVKGKCTSYHLEQTIQEKDPATKTEWFVPRGLWKQYKDGSILPKDGYLPAGKPGAVLLAESHVPISGDIYRHLIWKVMRTPNMRKDDAVEALASFKPEIASNYFDLSEGKINKQKIALGQNLWRPMLIRHGDFYTALDHLAVNLMFLRLDIWSNDLDLREIAMNIANALPSVAISPWIEPFHEEMYDWLQENVWHDLFNTHYHEGSKLENGWRGIKPNW